MTLDLRAGTSTHLQEAVTMERFSLTVSLFLSLKIKLLKIHSESSVVPL